MALLVCSVFLLLLPAMLAAQEPTIQMLGLTLPCAGCKVLDENGCKLQREPGPSVTDCREALPKILREIQQRGYTGRDPTILQARDFLFAIEGYDESKRVLLELLLATNGGNELITREALLFVKHHAPHLQQLLLAGKGTAAVAEALRRAAESEGLLLDPAFLAVLVARDPNLSLDALFLRLKGRSEEPIPTLEAAAAVYARRNQIGIADQLKAAADALRSCERDSRRCVPATFAGYPGKLGEYLLGAAQQMLLQDLQQKMDDPAEVLARLRALGPDQAKNERFRPLLIAAVQAIYLSHLPGVRSKALNEGNLNLLRALSKSDEQLAYLSANLLSKAAQEAAERGEAEHCLELLRTSFEIFPGDLDERARIVLELHSSVTIRGSPRVSAEFSRIVSSSTIMFPGVTGAVHKGRAIAVTILPLILVVFLVWLAACWFFFRRKVRESAEDEQAEKDLAEWRLQRERRELRSFFGLSEHATREDLTASYRRLARQIQPQRAGAGNPGFDELDEKYQKAQYLLFDEE